MTAREKASGPAVSIVVAGLSQEAVLRRCLECLDGERADAEVIAVAQLREAHASPLMRSFPWARLVPASEGDDVFRRRTLGLSVARGRLIALIEDHCRVTPGWLRAFRDAHRAQGTLLGGPVECGRQDLPRACALYLVEYGALMPPLGGRAGPNLLAVNAAYARDALLGIRSVWQESFYDNEVHDALLAAGHTALPVPAALVYSDLELTFRAAARHLYHGGLRFGAYRSARSTRAARALRALAAPLTPLVLAGRILRRVWQRRAFWRLRLPSGAPWLLGWLLAWCAGEALGLLRPGRARRV